MKRHINSNSCLWIVALLALISFSCDEDENTGPTGEPSASFEYVVDEDNPMMVHFTSTMQNDWAHIWDFGDNATQVGEELSHTYGAAGTYEVTFTVYGASGTTPAVVTQEITVEEAPFDGGMLVNGEGQWNVTHGTEGNTVTESPAGFNVTGPGNGENVMVWQAVEVEAGKSYQFETNVSSPGGEGIWSQLYFGTIEPQDGADYGDNKVYGVSSWGYSGSCISSSIDGSIFDLNCDGSNEPADGVFTFEAPQTIYIVFKTGSNTNPGHSVTWYNIYFDEI